jgi:hypothetical protein
MVPEQERDCHFVHTLCVCIFAFCDLVLSLLFGFNMEIPQFSLELLFIVFFQVYLTVKSS